MKIFNSFRSHKLLFLIIIISAFFRLLNLNIVPPHLTPDEAALGYNAYSILKTGRDEHGKLLPLVFKSFGDYKPGLYIYATVPFVAVLGLNEWSVRLPSALSGVLIVYLLYLIAKILFGKDRRLPLLVSAVAAINPWLIYFSRGAWEANFSLMLTLLGIYLFLRSLSEPKYLVKSAIIFGLTLVAYQGAKLSTSIVVILLVVLYWKEFWKVKTKYLLIAALAGLVVSVPILLSLISGKTGRLTVFSIFSNSRPDSYLQLMLDQNGEKRGDLNYYLSHSDTLDVARGILGRWFNHFSGRFLFFEGDWPNPRHSAPYQGMLLLGDMVFLTLGLFVLARGKMTRERLFVLLWLAVACLPAVLSRDQVHAVRSVNMSVPLVFVIALGAGYFWDMFSKFKFKTTVYLFGIGIYALGFVYFLDAYFVHVPKHNSKLWEYGYKQIIETITPIQQNYKSIKVQQSFAQPYIYFLFYQKYDPAEYQKQVSYVDSEYKGDVGYIEKLGNIQFVSIDWSINRGDKGSLIVGDGVRIPPQDSSDTSQFKLIKDIYYLNKRDLAFRIIEVKE